MTKPVMLTEPAFCPHSLNKYASLMTTGNGYMGIRASHEEAYTLQTRGMYLAGLYHRAGKGEINELVNLPDVVGVEITLNGEIFSLTSGVIESWHRELDFASGELRRALIWHAPGGARFAIESRRFVSAQKLPLFAMEVVVTPLDADASIGISTGIDATITNHGRQHLDETQIRVFGQHLLQGIYTTQDNRNDIAITSYCDVDGAAQRCFTAKERRLLQHNTVQAQAGQRVTLTKMSWVDWTSERNLSLETWGRQSLRNIEACAQQGYDALLAESSANWHAWWQTRRVQVTSSDISDQRALDYALYHLRVMTPDHDERSSIAAKGLTGKGIKATSSGILRSFCYRFTCLPNRKPREVYCVTAGIICRARVRKPAVTVGRARCSRGKALAAVMRKRLNSRRSTSVPGCGKSGLRTG